MPRTMKKKSRNLIIKNTTFKSVNPKRDFIDILKCVPPFLAASLLRGACCTCLRKKDKEQKYI